MKCLWINLYCTCTAYSWARMQDDSLLIYFCPTVTVTLISSLKYSAGIHGLSTCFSGLSFQYGCRYFVGNSWNIQIHNLFVTLYDQWNPSWRASQRNSSPGAFTHRVIGPKMHPLTTPVLQCIGKLSIKVVSVFMTYVLYCSFELRHLIVFPFY